MVKLYERPKTQRGAWNVNEKQYLWTTLTIAQKRIAQEGARYIAWTTILAGERGWLMTMETAAELLSSEFKPDYQPREWTL